MGKKYTISDIELLPVEVKRIYLSAIMNVPILKYDWDTVKSEYPEFFTEDKIERLSKIAEMNLNNAQQKS